VAAAALYILFFCSGVSGLIYQVVWVRAFGNVFGNTVYSTSVVLAIFMLGLGVGSYAIGSWADRRYSRAPDSLLRSYGWVEIGIAALGSIVSLLVPRLSALTAMASSYAIDASGWHVVSWASYAARGAMALVLLAPITLLMGGTLTLLIRYRVRQDVDTAAGWKVAALYAVNTAGAAAGAFLTDFALVPSLGLFATQTIAVALNLFAGAGALMVARAGGVKASAYQSRPADHAGGRRPPRLRAASGTAPAAVTAADPRDAAIIRPALALALTGFAAMGLEIVWLRHFTLLLGGFRAVYALALTVILAGIGLGALIGGAIDRRTRRPAAAFMVTQALLVAAALAGLAAGDIAAIAARQQAIDAMLTQWSPLQRWMHELWFNARPIALEAAAPSILMGCSFPLANAVIQHVERTVGQRAGILYLANTSGAVLGSLVAGYALLPWLGIQGSATLLLSAAATSIVVLAGIPSAGSPRRARLAMPIAALLIAVIPLASWIGLPDDYVLRRALSTQRPGERVLTISEGVNEIIAVTEVAGRGRGLLTNGHAMASTALLDQRYMRALAHIPLLSMSQPSRVLVIGFGVGNTTDAATLHPSVTQVDVVDLSRHVLDQAGYFAAANHDVLRNPRVAVYVNDGRQHLQMQPPAHYDLITLEPPPIAHAGVAALYSREFYRLARSRLAPGGYLTQWLPAYQVPAATSLAMTRAFLDVFPQSVLLSGMQAELLLVGTTAPAITIDPDRIAMALARRPDVAADLRRLDLGSVTEIVGTFVGSADTMKRATRDSVPVTDDRPLQEYSVRSLVGSGLRGVPASLFDLNAVATWCPRCFAGDAVSPGAAGLDTYLSLLDEAYRAPVTDVEATVLRTPGQRRLLGSAYLGSVVPDTDVVNTVLGTALAESGETADALRYLQRAVQLDPDNVAARHELGSLLLDRRDYAEAARQLEAAVRLRPDSAAARNDLGIALASTGRIDLAVDQFRQAVALEPDFAEARRNLAAALRARGAR
jgi:spermidine synthase